MGKGGRTMRKRRVLAVLLALSLAMSGNGMTVLAAETNPGQEQSVVKSPEETEGKQSETPGEGEESKAPGEGGESVKPGIGDEGAKPEEGGESATPGEGDESVKPGEGDGSATPGEGDESVKPDEGDESATPGEGDGSVKPGESDESGTQETPDKEEKPAASTDDEGKKSVEEQPKEPAEKPEETQPADQNYVSRIVTFTDDTGMRISYDANASMQYRYVVENGVLTAVLKQSTTVSGNTIEEPMVFGGNVELKQPEEGEQYTSIAASVFSGNQGITYVKLPAGVECIGAEAFKGCTALKGVYLPAGVNKIENSAFENCTSLTQINIPKAVTAIGDSAFKGDTRLYLVFMKDMDYSELKSIGAEAFSGCTVLSQFCSHSDFVFPVKLESIGEKAFKDCKAVKKIDLSSNNKLTALGAYVFAGCTGLTDLTPGETLSRIPEGAFEGCNALVCVNFVNGETMTIGRAAFKGCYGLKQIVLPQTVSKIETEAFLGCTKLKQLEIQCYKIQIESKAFPSDAEDLVIVAEIGSNGYKYALENKFRVPDEKTCYRYTVEDINGVLMPEDKDSKGTVIAGKYIFPGGTIWVGAGTQTKAEENVNTQNKGTGVKSGELCYIYYSQTEAQKNTYTFITESLRCNGNTMQKKDGKYYFEMPAGGAVITAEFRANTPDNIKGQKVTVEFSNGTPLQNGKTDEYGYLGVELKVGQTSRMFLLDEDGKPIPATKLIAVKSSNDTVVKIDKNGVITAAGTGGKEKASATVTIEVKGGDGTKITINRTVDVTTAEAKSIILKASNYDSFVTVEGDVEGIQTASVKKNIIQAGDQKFKLKANVYDGEEGISKELTWTTSNAKVATLKSDKTTAASPVNEVTILKGCEGEATITVTAKNAADAEKEKITQKFVVRVYEEGFRLTGSKITVNPRMEEGTVVELISAYGIGLDDARITLYEEKTLGTTPFTAEYDGLESSDICKRFRIKPVSETIKDGTYKVRVGVNGDTSEKNLMPLTITVKASVPKPTIKFNEKKAKFNLFYKNGGTNSKGETISVITEITKLGNAKISKVALEPLTKKADDGLFLENFVIDEAGTDLAAGKVAIKRSGNAMRYTQAKKAAVTGYLVIYYEGYGDDAAKKVKVTMPTGTTAPQWALRKTKGSYRADVSAEQEINLEIYDKKSKNKETVVLDESYTVTEEKGDIALVGSPEIKDGTVSVKFWPDGGKMKLVLRNAAWDSDKNGKERTLAYTYTVSVSRAKPTVKTDQSAVSLNLNYPEREAKFKLVSNLSGLQIDSTQTFTPVVTKKNAAEIEKLRVTYENGEGVVAIKSGQAIKKGTYKFECDARTEVSDLKKTTLTVKVVDSKPTITLGKGSLQLNKVVYDNNNAAILNGTENGGASAGRANQALLYRETSEVTFKVSSKPEGYTLASVGDGSEETEIVCITKNKAGAETYFTFDVEEDPEQENGSILRVSLKDKSLNAGNYKFKMTPRYRKEGATTVSAKPVNVTVKVISTDDIYLTASAKGKINLLNREGEPGDKNGIVYTPALKNIVGEIENVKIYDAGTLEEESKYFDICMIDEGKNKGKLFVTPKKIEKAQENPGDPVEYTYAELEHNKSYAVRIWVQVKGYAGDAKTKGGVLSRTIRIKTEQILPKVTTDKTSMDVFLSTKDYNASFVVKPKTGSVGTIEEVYFDEKDELANDSFTLIQTPQADGSMKVTVHLKEAVGFANGTTNNVKFYVKYKGQGTKTSKKATGFTMKIKVH